MQQRQASAESGSDRLLRQIIQENADGLLILRGDEQIRFANPAAERLLGRPLGELVGEVFRIPKAGGREEVVILRPDARVIVELRTVEIALNTERAYLVSLREVTEQRQARDALQFLVDASQKLAGSLDRPTTLATVAR